MADCKCDLGNIIDEETFNVRVIRELCNISNSVGSTELLRMVDQTDDGDVQFIRTSNGDFELDGETSYTPIGTVIPYKHSSGPGPEPAPLNDGKLRFTVNVNSTGNVYYFDVNFEPSVSDYVVDWGDNTTSTGITNHTYSSTGEYQITVSPGTSNKFPLIKFNANQYIKSVDSVYPYVETTGYFYSLFQNSTLQSVCSNFFENNSQITDIQSCFYGCTNLSKIPNDLCSYFTNVTRMTNFLRNTSIESLPQGLLDNCTNVTTLEYFCSGCSQLKTIPELLFNNNLKCDHFNFAFSGCTSLKLVKNLFCDETTGKTTRFSPMTGIGHIYFTSLFNRTSYTGSDPGEAPSLWEYTYGPTLHSNNCFSGAGNNATSITNYNSIPSAWGGPA